MKASIRDLFPAFYDSRQTASSMVHVGHVDRMLIDDRTYFVVEAGGELIACGGWSRRDKLFSGSADQEGLSRGSRQGRGLPPAIADGDAARIAAVRAVCVSRDFTPVRTLPDGVLLECAAMEKPIE